MENVASLYNHLVWQIEAGADEALDSQAGLTGWGGGVSPAPSAVPQEKVRVIPAPTAQKQSTPARVGPAALPPTSVEAHSLEALRDELIRFEGCPLKTMAMNLVFAAGNPAARIMIVGDVPGEDEDRQGTPFAGAAGQLLDNMLLAIGLSRKDVYLTNMVFWRPPGNRTPSEQEIAACLPFTERHIALVKPALLLLMGQTTMRNLLRTKDSFAKKRGVWTQYTPPLIGNDQVEGVRTLPLYTPAYLLRQPAAKRQMWADLQQVRKEINSTI